MERIQYPVVTPLVKALTEPLTGYQYTPSVRPVLQLPLLSNLHAIRGTDPTFSRAIDVDGAFTDFEGLIRSTGAVQSGRFEGARRVDNLARPHSDNLTLGLFINPLNGATTDGDNVVTFAADPISRVQRAAAIPGDQNGRTGVFSATVSVSSGSKQFRFRNTHIGDDNYDSQDFIATEIPQRFSFIASYTGAGTQLNWHFLNGSAGDAGDIIVHDWQYEDVTGQANINPSEYVAAHVDYGANALGVQFFERENGNTLGADGVVTEGPGSPLTTLQGVWIEGDNITHTPDTDDMSTWTPLNGGCTKTGNQKSPSGKGDAWQLTQIDASNDAEQSGNSNLTVSNKVVLKGRIKNVDATQSRILLRDVAGANNCIRWLLDWTGGVPSTNLLDGTGLPTNEEIKALRDGWYEIKAEATVSTTGNHHIQVFPESGVNVANSALFWGMEFKDEPLTLVRTSGTPRTVGVEALSDLSADVYGQKGGIALKVRNYMDNASTRLLFQIGNVGSDRIVVQVSASGAIQIGCFNGGVSTFSSWGPGEVLRDVNLCVAWDFDAQIVRIAADGVMRLAAGANANIPVAATGFVVGNSQNINTSVTAAHACLSDVRVWDEYIDDDTMLKVSAA